MKNNMNPKMIIPLNPANGVIQSPPIMALYPASMSSAKRQPHKMYKRQLFSF